MSKIYRTHSYLHNSIVRSFYEYRETLSKFRTIRFLTSKCDISNPNISFYIFAEEEEEEEESEETATTTMTMTTIFKGRKLQ